MNDIVKVQESKGVIHWVESWNFYSPKIKMADMTSEKEDNIKHAAIKNYHHLFLLNGEFDRY